MLQRKENRLQNGRWSISRYSATIQRFFFWRNFSEIESRQKSRAAVFSFQPRSQPLRQHKHNKKTWKTLIAATTSTEVPFKAPGPELSHPWWAGFAALTRLCLLRTSKFPQQSPTTPLVHLPSAKRLPQKVNNDFQTYLKNSIWTLWQFDSRLTQFYVAILTRVYL